jgi:uncharacterized protein (TIRG00374 family)
VTTVESTANPPGFLRRHGAKLVASAIITAGIVYTIHKGGLKFLPEGGDFAQVRWWTIPAYLATLIGMSYFRAVRWRFLLRRIAEVPKRRLLAVSWIGFAAILMMPFRIGEIVRPYMIREKGKISMTAATSSVVAERIVDGLYLSIILAIALIFVPHIEPLPDKVVGLPVTVAHVRMSGFIMLGVFAVAFTVIAIFYFARGFAHRFTMATVGRVSTKLAEKLTGIFEKFADGLHFLGSGKDAWGFMVETTFYWALNAGGMWILAWGCGVTHADGSGIAFGEACALMGMLGVTILIPGPPGLLGVFQAGIYAGMTMYYPTSIVIGPGAAYVFLLYMIQLVWTLVAAGFFLVTERNALRVVEEAEGIGKVHPFDAPFPSPLPQAAEPKEATRSY